MKNFLLFLLVAVSTNAFPQVPPYVPTTGLVGWWPFTGNAMDSSGMGNNGTVFGPTLTSDRFGHANSAYHCNRANNDYINVPHSASLDSCPAITISLWVYLLSEPDYNHFVNKTDQSTNNQYAFACQGTGLYFYYANWPSYFTSGVLPSINSWHHLVLTYNYDGTSSNSQVRFYLDGLEGQWAPTTVTLQTTTYDLRFGSYANNSVNTVDGNIDDIGIWNRALTQAEVTALYNSTIGINEISNPFAFSISPNPAHYYFRIESEIIKGQVEIYNAIGELVYSEAIKPEPVYFNQPSGVYFVKVNDTENVFIQKLIIE